MNVQFESELFCRGDAAWLVMQQKAASPLGAHWPGARCGPPALTETGVGAGLGLPLAP